MKKSNEKSNISWVDPDDAPEITDDWIAEADLLQGETLIRRGRPRKINPKTQVTLRIDREVLDFFKDTGPGWQTRLNEALHLVVANAQGERHASKLKRGSASKRA